jgi:periplasmic mercuric ion binding protein
MRRTSATSLFLLTLIGASQTLAAERVVSLRIENMTCALCHITVQAAIESVPGVTKVSVSQREASATVVYDDTATNPAALAAASTNAGYPATAIAQ